MEDETNEPVGMLTAEPVIAETFDGAVQIYQDRLCDPATAANLSLTGSGGWVLNGEAISDGSVNPTDQQPLALTGGQF